MHLTLSAFCLLTVAIFARIGAFPQPNTFSHRSPISRTSSNSRSKFSSSQPSQLFQQQVDESDPEVKVGSKEYYAGFLSRDLDEAGERVAGDKVLLPTLKFAAGSAVVIGLLFFGFLSSNGLI